ncbi:MAG: AmpG family muropeptide MFS transporter [bacterium]
MPQSSGFATQRLGWRDTVAAFRHPRVITMLFLGFSAGLPLLLIFSSLSLWLREAGVERSVVTLFSWAALGYSFKFVWAPLVDALRLPLLARLGRRRSWMLLSQSLVIAAIVCIALQDPLGGPRALMYMSAFAVLLGFSAATQDIVIDAYRIESAPPRLQALMSATYIGGYRIGMLVAGAGALFLASYYGSTLAQYEYTAWRSTYLWMAAAMAIGVAATLVISEPARDSKIETESESKSAPRPIAHDLQLLRLFALSALAFVLAYALTAGAADAAKSLLAQVSGNRALAGLMIEFLRLALALGGGALVAVALIRVGWVDAAVATRSYVQPVQDFFARHGAGVAWLLLGLIALYRISDIVLGVIANVFYQDLGFSKVEIATVAKTYGLILSLVGGFLGGALALRYGVMRILFVGALLSAATNLLFLALAAAGDHLPMLYLVISADNLSAGLASAAFVAFLSALTNVRFTAVQFAIFTSLMTLLPKGLGGYSGAMVDAIGYSHFFLFTAVLGVPVLALIWLARRRLSTMRAAMQTEL